MLSKVSPQVYWTWSSSMTAWHVPGPQLSNAKYISAPRKRNNIDLLLHTSSWLGRIACGTEARLLLLLLLFIMIRLPWMPTRRFETGWVIRIKLEFHDTSALLILLLMFLGSTGLSNWHLKRIQVLLHLIDNLVPWLNRKMYSRK